MHFALKKQSGILGDSIVCFFVRMSRIVNKKRPINLDLGTMKFPVMAIASILHRLSGLGLFLLLPVMIWYLHQSLGSPESFASLQITMTSLCSKFLVWAFCTALAYHLLAGIRHILMDAGIGEHLCTARIGAWLVIAAAVIVTILLGIWIW